MFNFIRRSLKRNFGVDKEYYRFIDDMFGFVPNNIELYKVALIHKSASQSISGHHINNERLEYLGDAVIESITSDYLFIEYPDGNEGFLTQMRSKLVSRQSLNDMARKLGLDKYLICHSSAGGAQKHIYGDAFEAMIGAIYLDKGYDFVNRLLINVIFAKCMNLDDLTESENDFKSRLIEWCQKNRHTIVFRSRKGSESRATAPVFYTTVLIDNIEVGHGSGDSKKSAEQQAARSVSVPLNDEMCSDLLDRLDTMNCGEKQQGDGNSESGTAQSRSRRRRRRRRRGKGGDGAAANAVTAAAAENSAEESVSATEAGDGANAESAAKVSGTRERRKRRHHNAEHAGESLKTAVAADDTAADSTAHHDAPANHDVPANAAEAAPSAEAAAPAEQHAPKRRGRRKKSESAAVTAEESANKTLNENEQAEAPAPKRRGRPRKQQPAAVADSSAAVGSDADAAPVPAPKRRGRPRKQQPATEAAQSGEAQEAGAATPVRKRCTRKSQPAENE